MSSGRSQGEEAPPSKELRKSQVKVNRSFVVVLNELASRKQLIITQNVFSNLNQIRVSDPVYQISLENSMRENLQTCSTLHGDAFNSAISRMHPSELAQVKQALKLPWLNVCLRLHCSFAYPLRSNSIQVSFWSLIILSFFHTESCSGICIWVWWCISTIWSDSNYFISVQVSELFFSLRILMGVHCLLCELGGLRNSIHLRLVRCVPCLRVRLLCSTRTKGGSR